ncbi:hypothetical protein, partial [Burkholderia cepacia]|uniref:hypothetical protein n=1 Tax=Burkholderia cepacia TaxID=292 RepID=UPI00196AF5A0
VGAVHRDANILAIVRRVSPEYLPFDAQPGETSPCACGANRGHVRGDSAVERRRCRTHMATAA